MDTPRRGRALTSEIDVTIADRVEDVDEALEVVHDGFVEAGYHAPPLGPADARLLPEPGHLFLVARIDGRRPGRCAVVVDGPFGLPSDRAFAEENDALRPSARPDPRVRLVRRRG